MNEKKSLNSARLLIVFFVLSVILLSLTKIEDTDTWMHLSAGRLMWESKSLTPSEVFAYPSEGKTFGYSTWLFGLIYYAAYYLSGVNGVILLKMITVAAAFYLLVKDSLVPYRNYVVSIVVMTLMVIVSRHRFVERPDTFLMFFLSFSIFSINAFIYENKKYIYALPFFHILWVNSHTSINLMFIPFLSFIAGGIIQQAAGKRGFEFPGTPSTKQLKVIGIVFLVSFAATFVSPNTLSQYTAGAQLIALDWWKQEIYELNAPEWEIYKTPYILTAVLALSFVLNWKRFSLMHFLLVLPFIALSFTAYRFIFLLGIVSGPLIARNLAAFFDGLNLSVFFSKRTVAAAAAVWIALYSTLTLANVKPFGDEEKAFGLGVNHVFVPEGALKYMDKQNISGRVFNLFQWGGYIIWRDFPKRTVFVDGRGYLTEDLLEKTITARNNRAFLDELQKTYGFESILVNYPEGENMKQDIFLSHKDWALVYWDDYSLLFLKRGEQYGGIINNDEYRFVNPEGDFNKIKSVMHDENYTQGLIKELKRNIRETGSQKAYAFLGYVYNEIGLFREAIELLSGIEDRPFYSHIADAYSGMAYAYVNLGNLDEAIKYYKKALSAARNVPAFYNLALAYAKKGELKTAAGYLEKAVKLNKNTSYLYPPLIEIYSRLGREDEIKEYIQMQERARLFEESERHFKAGTQAYIERKLDVAFSELKKSIDLNPSSPAPYSRLGDICFENGMIKEALEYQKKAVAADPEYAKAHYGLGYIYKKIGDMKSARRHFKEFLELEPKGSMSRKVKKELNS